MDGVIPDSYPSSSVIARETTVSLEAVPASGFTFVGWTGSEISPDKSITTQMTCTKTITASFVQDNGYFLNMDTNGNGSVTPSVGTHSYSSGETVTITAEADKGYRFTSWTGEVENSRSASTTVTLDESKTVIANFAIARHIISIKVNGAGSVKPNPANYLYNEGTTVKIVATPDAGSSFKGWTGNVSDASSNTTTIVVKSDQTVIANFSGGEFTLTLATEGNGTITPSPGDYPYIDGTSIEITAIPYDGFTFEGWTGGVKDSSSTTTTVTVDNYKTITAMFTRTVHTLTINTEGKGSVNPATGTHTYDEDETITLVATPENGYEFSGWIGEVADANSPNTSVTMASDKTVTARFTRVYALNINVEGEGIISPEEGVHSYTEGTSVTVSAVPGDGYKFTGWSGGVSDVASPITTVTMNSDKVITATFETTGLAPWVIVIIIVVVAAIAGGLFWFTRRKPEVT